MKWFFLLLLTQTKGDLHEGFLWYDPSFDNKEECIEWVNNNPGTIFSALEYHYPGWEIKNTLCVRQDRLEDMKIVPNPEGNSV